MSNINDIDQQEPQDVAIQALLFLTQDEDRLLDFMALTGLAPHDLRASLTQPGFAEGLLDYILSEDKLILSFAQFTGLSPAEVQRQRNHLPGAFNDA